MCPAHVEVRGDLQESVLSLHHVDPRDQTGHPACAQVLSHLTGRLHQFLKASLPSPKSDVTSGFHVLLLTALYLAFRSPYYLTEDIFSVYCEVCP